ncbi:MAG: NfeD family protein [Phycisphaeraceae bacterium]
MMNARTRRLIMFLALALLALGHALTSFNPPALAQEPGDESPKADAPAPAPAAPKSTVLIRRDTVPLPGGAKVYIVPIEGNIYTFTLESMQRRVERAIEVGAEVIVFEVNTFGGQLDTALEICKFIRGKIQSASGAKIPTIAWINDKAYSAGIMISSSCDHIIMAPAGTTGDCAPINALGGSLAPTERAKILSPLLSEFRENAEDNGYPYALFHAMCVLGPKVFLVEHKSEKDADGNPRRLLVNDVDYQIMVEGKSRSSIADAVSELLNSAAGGGDEPVGGSVRELATEADRGQWKLVEQVHAGNTLLTLSTRQAVKYGLALEGTFVTDQDIKAFLNATEVIRVQETWSETMAGFLVSWPVRFALIAVLLVGFGIEMLFPGLVIPAIVGAVALIILIISPMLVGLSEFWHLLLIFVGFILLAVELFVTPGFGVLGISGIVAILAGLIMSVVPVGGNLPNYTPGMVSDLQNSILWTFGAFVVSGIALIVLVRHHGSFPLFDRLALSTSQKAMVSANNPTPESGLERRPVNSEGDEVEGADEDPRIAAARKELAGSDAVGDGRVKVGDEGRSITELRPSGRVRIEGRDVDVASVGGWIDVGRRVRVVRIEGSRITVEMI